MGKHDGKNSRKFSVFEVHQAYIDILRGLHLTCFAAGMGPALYFDFRTFQTLRDPVTTVDVQGLERIHIWICAAFVGLWITGVALIYIRTAFDPAALTPKLWLKLGLMTVMIWNARLIGTYVIPAVEKNMGQPMTALPKRQLVIATQIAVFSMFCWTSGLMLGSSVVLKTASWDVLWPLTLGWFLLASLVGHSVMAVRRTRGGLANSARSTSDA